MRLHETDKKQDQVVEKQENSSKSTAWRLCVAPMLDWTDRHCRFFHRLLTRKALLHTEMVTTGALLHGNVARHLDFSAEEHPLALQLGGSEPAALAQCARLAQAWGYDQINLNCGCPSERVQHGAFGACLMAQGTLVADCLKAMQEATTLPVTVKHRVGIDKTQSYGFVRDFVGELYHRAQMRVFIVHARNAWLQGLSPKQNRDIPPLRYEYVYQLKRDFTDAVIVLNGGVRTNEEIAQHLQQVDGVMVGRQAYHNPWLMHEWDRRFFPSSDAAQDSPMTREQVQALMLQYVHRVCHAPRGVGAPEVSGPHAVTRHMLGLYWGTPGARAWRRGWSTPSGAGGSG